MKQKTTRHGAFTLVEILVVVGVIALLAALLFPVFGRVRENGRRVSCTNNLRQLGLAFQQYTQDSSGRYPLAGQLQTWASGGHWATGGEGGLPKNYSGVVPGSDPAPPMATQAQHYGLANPNTFEYIEGHEAYPEKGALFPYVKSVSSYVCPSARDNDKKKLSYSMNCAIAGLNKVRVKNPNEIVLLVDEGDSINDAYFWASDNGSSTDSLFKGHNGGGNILFTDGSVKFFNFDSLPLDKEAAGRTLKSALTGPVRFRDPGFGPAYAMGSNYIPAINNSTAGSDQFNTCSEEITIP